MKRLITKTISVMFCLAMLLSVTLTAFAANNELSINSESKVNVGDKIKYTLYMSDTTEDIIGFEMRIFYDDKYLKLDKESVEYDKFNGVIHNLDLKNRIATSWTDFMNPVGFSTKAPFISMEFEVLQAGDTEISQFVTDMYGDDMTFLKSYKWTYSIEVNGKDVSTDKTPLISEDADTLAQKQGSFINYLDGMGEENTPNKEDHQAVTGVIPTTGVVSNIVENTRIVEVENNDGSMNMTPLIIVVAAIIVIGAIVAIVIVKVLDDNKKKNEGNDISNNDSI